MESNTFKSVTFGGFDKQDVVSYIEKVSKEHADALDALQKERDTLQNEKQTLENQLASANQHLASLNAEADVLRTDLARARTQADSLSALPAEIEQLSAENARAQEEIRFLQPDAESYREFRTRIGDIECEARKRAADLENETNAHLTRLAADFRAKYQDLVTAFDSTSSYVTGELRKVEVNLTQLPRALDQVGVELTELEDSLTAQKSE